jgi:hypothetical protein
MLILYITFRPESEVIFKTAFVGIFKLGACDSVSIATQSSNFIMTVSLIYKIFTSDGASVMLGKRNGVAAVLKREIEHLSEQHCVTHREDLGIDDAWKQV